jgi:hypothetical protein
VAHHDQRIKRIKRSSVYGIFQDSNGPIYIGQTRQPLSRRLDAHKKNVRTGYTPPLYEHLRDEDVDLERLSIQALPFTDERAAIRVYGLDNLLNAIAGSDVKPWTGYAWSSDEVDVLEDAESISDAARRTDASWSSCRDAMLKLGLIEPASRDRVDWDRWKEELGTMPDGELADRIPADITSDAVAKRRRELNIDPCPGVGGTEVLSDQEAEAALQAYAEEAITYTELANRFGVHRTTIGKLIRGETYTDIDRPAELS